MARQYSSTPRSSIAAAARQAGRSSAANAPRAITRASSQPSRARRAIPTPTASRPISTVQTMRSRTPRVNAQSRGSRYIAGRVYRESDDRARRGRTAQARLRQQRQHARAGELEGGEGIVEGGLHPLGSRLVKAEGGGGDLLRRTGH